MTLFQYLDSRITQVTIEYVDNSMLVQTAEQNAARLITKAQFILFTALMVPKHLLYYILYRLGVVKQPTKQELGDMNKAKIASMMAARAEQIKNTLEESKLNEKE